MALDIWRKDDIRNVLLGIDLACMLMASDRSETETAIFREGFEAALSAVAVSLGICSVDQSGRFRPSVSRAGFPQLMERGW